MRWDVVVVGKTKPSHALVSYRVVHRSGEVGSKKAKRPTPASTHKMQETSVQDNTPAKKRKKMGVC